MIIRTPELIVENGTCMYSVRVDRSGGVQTLWFCLDEKYSRLVSERSDAALAALLIPAMSKGEDIFIEGTVSEKLYFNLSGPYQAVIKQIIPSLAPVRIIPSEIHPANITGNGIALGFSGGIDSFCALADHFFTKVPPGFRITHLLFNNVGSHEPGETGRKLFQKRYERLHPVTDRMGLPLISIDSNMDTFYDTLDFQQTHTQRNASVALLLQQGIRRFYYASGYHYSDIFIGASPDMGYSDPVTLPLLSTESLDLISTGSQYTRVEKTLKVAQIDESYQSLDVCVDGTIRRNANCSRCYKCKRTMLTLDIAGFLDRYAEVFDIGTYRQVREKYIAEVLCSKNPYMREISDFMKRTGYPVPLRSRIYRYARSIPGAKKILQGIRRFSL
jgi:hypothetical protein